MLNDMILVSLNKFEYDSIEIPKGTESSTCTLPYTQKPILFHIRGVEMLNQRNDWKFVYFSFIKEKSYTQIGVQHFNRIKPKFSSVYVRTNVGFFSFLTQRTQIGVSFNR